MKNVLNQYFISLNCASFQHLNKNHIHAKFRKLAKCWEAVICILLVSFIKAWDLFQLCLESWEFRRKDNKVANVKNRFLKGVTQNHCLGFSHQEPSRDLRQTSLKAWPYLLKLAPPLNKHYQKPCPIVMKSKDVNSVSLTQAKNSIIFKIILCHVQLSNKRHECRSAYSSKYDIMLINVRPIFKYVLSK